MQNTGTLSAHHKHVTHGCKNYAKYRPSNVRVSQNESDDSTSSHDQYGHSRLIKCRRRRKVNENPWLLLVLIFVIINLEYVIGAVNSNSILNTSSNVNKISNKRSIKFHDNSKNNTRTLLDIDDEVAFIVDNEIEEFTNVSLLRPQVIYQNEFAVHILGGSEVANEVARRHGFTNMGQVSLHHLLFNLN